MTRLSSVRWRACRAAVDSPGLRVDEAVGAGYVSRPAPQTYRYVSQRVRLPLQSPLLPACLIRNDHRPRQSPQGRHGAQVGAASQKVSDRYAPGQPAPSPERRPKSGVGDRAASKYGITWDNGISYNATPPAPPQTFVKPRS